MKNQMETRQRKAIAIDMVLKTLSYKEDVRLNDLWKNSINDTSLYSIGGIWNTCNFFINDFKNIAGKRCIILSIKCKGTYARLKKPKR
jgi:hypothetical protein